MFQIVKKAIDEFNPMGLLPHAPDNEYDIETIEIASQINKNSSINEIAEVISKVLSESFGNKFEPKKCISTAEVIYQSLILDDESRDL